MSNNVVVVSSAKLVRELDQKGATTSDRPAIHAAEAVYGDYELVFARHGTLRSHYILAYVSMSYHGTQGLSGGKFAVSFKKF